MEKSFRIGLVYVLLLLTCVTGISCLSGYSPVQTPDRTLQKLECEKCHTDAALLEQVADPIDTGGGCTGGEG